MPSIGASDIAKIRLVEQGSAPASPASGYLYVYGKNDGLLYFKNDAGAEYALGQGLSNPMTTANDLIIGGVSGVPARLAKGTDGQVLTVDPTTHNLVWADPTGGAGGGDSTSTGAYASLPAASNDGNLYFSNDSPYLLRDNGSAWAAFGPILPLTVPPSSGWSWVNQGSATIDTASGAHFLEGDGTTNYALRCRARSAPSTPYTITVLFQYRPQFGSGNQGSAGLFWRNSSDGKLTTVWYDYRSVTGAPNLYVQTMNSPTSNNAVVVNLSTIVERPRWFRLIDDGTNRKIAVSMDGIDFGTVIYDVTRTTHLTPDQVGFFVDGGSTTYKPAMRLLSWKEA